MHIGNFLEIDQNSCISFHLCQSHKMILICRLFRKAFLISIFEFSDGFSFNKFQALEPIDPFNFQKKISENWISCFFNRVPVQKIQKTIKNEPFQRVALNQMQLIRFENFIFKQKKLNINQTTQ